MADSISPYDVMERPIGPGVFRFLYGLISLLALAIMVKSVQLQVFAGEHSAAVVQRSRNLSYLGPGWRGIIYAADGQALVENIPVFDLLAVHSDLPPVKQWEALTDQLAPVINLPVAMLNKLFADNKTAGTFLVKENLSKAEVAKLEVAQLKGLYVLANVRRHYPAGAATASVLGYTAKINNNDLVQDDYYLLTDQVGRLGLEQAYEAVLRGEHRSILLNSNQSANYLANAQPGGDLHLTLDASMQRQLYQVMTNVLNSAGLRRGAAIIQDPNSGAIKALVSLPSFDANIFENYLAGDNTQAINRILQDKNQPLFNRVVSGRYSPGSTIKPFYALVGLEEGVVTPQTIVNATGGITVRSVYDPTVTYTFKDWKVHGLTDLKKAIADSVDVYFYALGGGYGNIKGLGVDKLVNYLKALWADKILGIDLPGESSGFVPTPEWKQANKGESWFVGDTYNISIGQGDLQVTPLWLNAYVGAIANGGQFYQPFLVQSVQAAAGSVLKTTQSQVLTQMPFNSANLATVRAGMRQTVTDGTATLLNNLPQPVAAKTGTAQISGRGLNSLFIVYGPYENPNIAMTILVENIRGQGLAIRIAHDFLSWYFSRQP